MKKIKGIVLFLVVLSVLAGCRRDLGGLPGGTYLQMTLKFPDSSPSGSSRLLHSQADELVVSLTYPGESPVVVEFPRNEESIMSVLIEDLKPGNGVLLEVSVGLNEYNLPLTSASVTLDIQEGSNSPAALTLQPIDYTVSGTLYDSADQILANHTIRVNGTSDITTDGGGKFSLTVSSQNLEQNVTFRIDNTETYELTRTNLYLLQNYQDLRLKASPEIYLDFFVFSPQGSPLAGTAYTIREGRASIVASGTADSNGRIVYQNSNYTSASSHDIELEYNSLFVQKIINTLGAPGAVIDDVVIDPYIIFPDLATDSITRMEDMAGSGLQNLAIGTFVSSIERLSNFVADYDRNRLIVSVDYYESPSYKSAVLIFDGWNDTSPDVVDVTSVIQVSPTGFSARSVPQMALLDNGNVLVATTYGAFLVNVAAGTVPTVWETNNDFAFLTNGAFEAEDGNLYVMGIDRQSLVATDQQRIWQLNSDGTKTLEASLPAAYDDFPVVSVGSDITVSGSNYSYLLGLYQWKSRIVSLKVMNASETGGEVVFLDGSGSSWNLDGSPITQSPESSPLDYVIPLGVLPDNRFYFIEERSSEDRLVRLDDPGSNPTESYSYLFDGSGGTLHYYYYYYEPSSASP